MPTAEEKAAAKPAEPVAVEAKDQVPAVSLPIAEPAVKPAKAKRPAKPKAAKPARAKKAK
jgi:hypothetical protein